MSPVGLRRKSSAGLFSGGFRAWGRRHGYSLLSSLGTLFRHPVASAMTVVVLAVAMSLPAGLWVMLDNASRIAQEWERLDTLSVFLDESADDTAAMQAASRFSAWPEVAAVDPISPAEGLAELGSQIALGELAGRVDANPLPWVLEVTPTAEANLPALAQRLRNQAETDQVIVDLLWLERLEAMVDLMGRLTLLLAVLFGVAVAFIVGNTIRMEIQNRHEEIEVLALVGATAGFIRRPFLYSGLWYGLGGGLLAWAMVALGVWVLQGPAAALSASYEAEFNLQALPGVLALSLVGGGGVLGVVGSWLAVGRHLRNIHP